MHDIAVIGGGPGGYAVAFRAAARGLDVALVEEREVGGTCLHRGCIPSKALLHVAGVLEEVERAEVLGLRLAFDGVDAEALAAFRDDVVTRMYKGLQALVTKRTTFHRGRGRVVRDGDHLAVEVADADGEMTRLQARNVVLATGSRPRSLPGVDVDGEVVQTSDQALFADHSPERAVIIGAGAIGLEFASIWRPMGAHVTIVEALDRVLPLEDEDSSAEVARAFRRRGVEVMTSAVVRGVSRDGGVGHVDVEVDGDGWTLEADRVLVAIGREPNTAGSGAAELGVVDDRGFVTTDEWGATEVPGLWAVGDVRPTLALAHAAFAEGFVVADRIAGVDGVRPVDHTHTPRVTYCHPEVASVGLTEAQARERHGEDVAVTTYSLRANAKAMMTGLGGFVKVVHRADAPPPGAPPAAIGGPVLGVHVVGPQATDIIAEGTLATAWEAVPAELAAITHAHPSLYESLGEAFQSAAGTPFHVH